MLPVWLWAKLVVKVVFKSILLLYGVREVTNVTEASKVTRGGLHHTPRTKSAFTGREQAQTSGEATGASLLLFQAGFKLRVCSEKGRNAHIVTIF